MSDAIFKCGTHNFTTNNLDKLDDHYAAIEHSFDLHVKCANKCGTKLHIKPTQKVANNSNRIPRGYLCKDCKKKVQTAPEIKEAGEK